MDNKVQCRKCLLDGVDENEYVRSVREHIDKLAADKRVTDEKYRERLAVCLECDFLDRGTCEVCGCYVEFRALMKDKRCPKNKWTKP